MMNEDYDVIIVGGSNAGATAAAAAIKRDKKVLVIDKEANSGFLFRNTIASINSNAQKRAGIKINKDELIDFLTLFNQGHSKQSLLRKWADESGRIMNFLEDEILKPNGAHLYAEKDAYYETLANTAFPTGNEVTKNEKEWDRGWGLYMVKYDQDHGVDFRYNTRLEKLLVNDSKVIGIRVTDIKTSKVYDIKANDGVILCTGGYGADRALMEKWNPAGLKTNMYAQSPRNDGSGIVAALKVGAKKDLESASIVFDRGGVLPGTNGEEFYDMSDWRVKGYLVLGSYPLLKVNLKGKRFFNESAPYQFAMNSLAQQPGYLEVMIWNDEVLKHLKQFHTLGCSRLGWPGILDEEGQRTKIQEKLKQGYIQKADTIEELAKKLYLPSGQLKKTIDRYNELCERGKDFDFGKEKYRLFPVKNGPYYGVTLGGVLLDTLDGLSVNNKMQVLNQDDEPIQGLYAAGNCSGGFFWGSYPDRVPGITASHAITFGYLAGENI